MGDAVIEFRHVTMKFGKTVALDDVDLCIERGSKNVIIGPSGSGKSTMLRCMNLFERPQSGEVYLNGHDMMRMSKKQLAKARQSTGMVFQSFNLYPHLTVLENLMLAPVKLKKEIKEEVEMRAYGRLRDVGLEDKALSYSHQLSGGQQQRVAIARALCMNPEILFFDEPTSALDPEMIQEVLDIMTKVAENKDITIVCVTHEMGFAQKMADRMLFLADGKILEDGTPDRVFNFPESERTKSFFSKILSKVS